MRFTPHQRHAYEDTRRKRLAAAKWQQRERDRLPLFSAEIGAKQPSIDTVMSDRIDRWSATEQANRDVKAAQWRDGRRRLAAMEPEARAAILAYWNGHKWLPGTSSYFADMLHSIETGRLVRQDGTFRFASRPVDIAAGIDAERSRKPPVIPGLTRTATPSKGPRP